MRFRSPNCWPPRWGDRIIPTVLLGLFLGEGGVSIAKILILCATWGFLFVGVAGEGVSANVQAATLRVLVLDGAEKVTVYGADDLEIRDVSRRVSYHSQKGLPLRIAYAPSGLRLNGRLYKTEHLIFHSSRNIRFDRITVNGDAHLYSRDKGIVVVETVDVEEYLLGVLGEEMPPNWEAEALKAQAVAARTYALHLQESSQGNFFDLRATTDHQVYHHRESTPPSILSAVEETRGMILTHGGHPILSAFHSSCGGRTENVKDLWGYDLPYLHSVSCPYDVRSPHHSWKKEIPLDRIEKSLQAAGYGVGTIAALTPYHRNASGRVDKMRVLHSRGELFLTGGDFRKVVGYDILPSAVFEVESIGSLVVFVGKGWGHGVGLCQWGAKGMAEDGHGFREILSRYYPGTDLVEMSE